jgi:hypothetical protein
VFFVLRLAGDLEDSRTGCQRCPRLGWNKAELRRLDSKQVHASQEHQLKEIDWINLAGEIEELGKGEKRSIERHLARIVEHLLKLTYASARTKRPNRQRWELTIREARHQVPKRLSESPSLRETVVDVFVDAYETRRNAALIALRLPDSRIPETFPWNLEPILDDAFFPDIKQTTN